MSKLFEGKVALVTGANAGIGRRAAEIFAEQGAAVAVVARNQKRGQETVDTITSHGGRAVLIVADMENSSDIAAIVPRTVELFGGLDFAFNNAGIVGDTAILHEQTPESWNTVISTNLTAIFLCMKYELQYMQGAGGGVIVNNSSGAGVMPQPYLSPYAAAKHGILGLTKTAAKEYADKNIRVNAVCPGLTDTPQLNRHFEDNDAVKRAMIDGLPMKRMGTPDDVANAVIFLCSPVASYISGESLFIDGALACR